MLYQAVRYLSRSTSRSAVSKLKPNEYSVEKAREYLSSFGGGGVSLARLDNFTDVACVTLSNPDRKNALTGKMMADLHDVVNELTNSVPEYRAVVVRGEKGDFCSGGDLNFVKQVATSDDGFIMCSFMGHTLHRLSSLPILSIAQLEGFTLGGGSELASACDLRVCQRDAKVGFVQGRMGVSPGWGGANKLVSILGRSKAIELLASASVLDSQQLEKIGFVNHVYSESKDFDQYVNKFTKIDRVAVQAAKQVISDVTAVDTFEEKLRAERDIFVTLWGGDLQQKALQGKPKHK